ncbi:MAG: imidazole glycerol phosphate synthase subunit HisH [Ignavibacteriaceae bacterium]|nr:imidazole glycerol phosphate synthase subunit HisH [Ignavibacteriaceae bacterium]
MLKIIILDYAMGNLRSVQKKVNSLGYEAIISSDLNIIKNADKLILPGVGHFRKGMENLIKTGIYDLLNEIVLNKKKPILGICLGMQLMTNHSEEGNCEGFGWINGETVKFKLDPIQFKVPHMGWNSIQIKKKSSIFEGLSENEMFYFVHSYYVKCKEKNDVLSNTEYGIEFTSAVWKENIYGVQFHPEKSHDWGSKLLRNFCEL